MSLPDRKRKSVIIESTVKIDEGEEPASLLSEMKSNRKFLLNVICMILVWLSGSFCYYMISFQLKYL